MTYRVVVTARARADALEVFGWLAERSPEYAERWHATLLEAVLDLANMPERHPVAWDETEVLGVRLRERLLGRRPNAYRLLLTVVDDVVTLHYVRHSARGPLSS